MTTKESQKTTMALSITVHWIQALLQNNTDALQQLIPYTTLRSFTEFKRLRDERRDPKTGYYGIFIPEKGTEWRSALNRYLDVLNDDVDYIHPPFSIMDENGCLISIEVAICCPSVGGAGNT